VSVATPRIAMDGGDFSPGEETGEGAGHPVLIAKHGADNRPGDIKGEGAGHPVA
jgi:hypothetical protein